jgi:hypothetical protein
MLRLARGQDPALPHREGPYRVAAKWFLRHWNDGTVRRRPTAQEIDQIQRDIPGVTVDVIVKEGDQLCELVDQDSYSYKIANIYVGAGDESDLIDKYERCVSALPFEINDEAASSS